MILEQNAENRDPRQHGIEDGLAVLRRLHEIRGTRANGVEHGQEQRDSGRPGSLPEAVAERAGGD